MGTEVLVMRSAPGPLLCENVETAGNKHESQHLTNTSCLQPAVPRHLTLVAATTNISRVVTAIGSLKYTNNCRKKTSCLKVMFTNDAIRFLGSLTFLPKNCLIILHLF